MNRSREGMGDGEEGEREGTELGLGWDRGRGDSCVERLEGGIEEGAGKFYYLRVFRGMVERSFRVEGGS